MTMTRRQLLLAQAAVPYLDKRQAAVHPGQAPSLLSDSPFFPVGFFGPSDPAHPDGGAVFMGVQLALENANARRPPGAPPFQLFSRWAGDPWRAGASAVVRLALDDRVVAVIGGIDSATTHLAEQVAAKALFPLLDPVSTDETANAAFVPWIFSYAPGDSLIARALAAAIGQEPYTLLAATDHGSRQLARALVRLAPPAERQDFNPPHLPPVPSYPTVAVLAPPLPLCAVVASLPPTARILAGPSANSRLCLRALRRPVLAPRIAGLRPELRASLEARFPLPGDAFTQLAYESTALLLECILAAGPDRAAVREQLALRFAPSGRRPVSSVILQEVAPL